MSVLKLFQPNQGVSRSSLQLLGLAWVASFIAIWWFSSFAVLPTPREVLAEFAPLISRYGLLPHLASSLRTSAIALAWTTALALGIAYASVVPALRPLTSLLGNLRFWGFSGVTVVFTLWLGGGHDLKIALLVFGMSGFFLAGMHDLVGSVAREKYDYARSLGMSEWRVVWEVVIRGTLDKAFDLLRQNAAMGWMLLTLVETLVRSEGGVGVLLANQSKHMQLAGVAAVQAVIFGVGLLQDALLVGLKRWVCPHAALHLERTE